MVQLISPAMIKLDLCVCVFVFSLSSEATVSFFLVSNPSFILSEAALEVGLVRRLNGFEPEENGCWHALPHFFLPEKHNAVLHRNLDFLLT